MSLEELAQAIEEKGFSRQAVLLRSWAGGRYVKALMQPQWRTRVEEAFGRETYTQLEHYCQQMPDTRELKRIFGGKLPEFPTFQPREYAVPPLEITVENMFDFSVLQKAAEITKQATELRVQAEAAVYGEVQERTKGNDDLLYEIYKDADHTSGKLDEQRLQGLTQIYYRKLSARTQRIKRLLDLSAPASILANEIIVLSEYIPSFEYAGEFSSSQEDSTAIADRFIERYCGQRGEGEEGLKDEFNKICGLASPLIQEGERLLNDAQSKDEQKRANAKNSFERWLAREQQTQRQRVIKKARVDLPSLSGEFFDREEFSKFHHLYPFSLDNINPALDDENAISWDQKPTQEELLRHLYKSSLLERNRFLADRYEWEVQALFNLLPGLQQLMEGGPVTNPDASPVSVLQNHYRFPNLQYSPAVMDAVRAIVPKLKPLLTQLSDVDLSDFVTSTKMRKKKEHTYIVEELPKDPLDVTYGNDSGCCVFVPEELEKLQNGVAVVEWLLNPSIRLFGIYRQEGEKKQRMGLVAGFETVRRKQTWRKSEERKRILACNSLELSRFGISGGSKTVQALVEYVESYLAGYAQAFGYHGCTMGRHSYNTSENFSGKAGDVVAGELESFIDGMVRKPFYSDIFAWHPGGSAMRTRPKSCYWLWREK